MTNKQLSEFKKYFKIYLDKLDLKYYDIFYHEEKIDSICQLSINVEAKIINVVYDPDINEVRKRMLDVKSPKYLAKHEALHVLLAEFKRLAKLRFINEDQIDDEEEKIVQKLAKLI